MTELDDDDHAIVARLRALRPEGVEPSWDQFGRDLARELDTAPPRPWWRRWWAPVAGLSLAGATVAAVMLWPTPDATPAVEEIAVVTPDAAPTPTPVPTPTTRPGEPILALGSEGELDDAALDDVDVVTEVMAALDDQGEDLGDVPDEPLDGLVPDLELEWIDDLDEDDLDAVTAWLDEET